MKAMKWIVVVWVGVFGFSAVAQKSSGAGSGGNAVVCYTDASRSVVSSIELFDYWEMARRHPGFGAVDLGQPGLSVAEKIRIFMERLAQFDPVRAKWMQDQASLIEANIEYYLADQIPVVRDDTSPLAPERPCFKEQFAVQFRTPAAGERRFLVKRSLYRSPLTSNDTRAGIILHEVIYRHAIEKWGHTNSDSSRLLNFVLAADPVARGNEKLLAAALDSMKLGLEGIIRVVSLPGAAEDLLLFGRAWGHLNRVSVMRDFHYRGRQFQIKAPRGSLVYWGVAEEIGVPGGYVHFENLDETGVEARSNVGEGGPIWRKASIRVNLDGSSYRILMGGASGFIPFQTSGGEKYRCKAMHYSMASNRPTVCEDVQLPFRVVMPLNRFNVTSRSDLRFSDSGTIHGLDAWSEAPLSLLSNLSDRPIQLTGLIRFDDRGLALSGQFITPFEFQWEGRRAIAPSYSTDPKTGEILFGVNRDPEGFLVEEQPLERGLPVLIGPSLRVKDLARQLCTDRGYFASRSREEVIETQRSVVAGTRTFYDVASRSSVTKTDEVVQIVSQLWCVHAPAPRRE